MVAVSMRATAVSICVTREATLHLVPTLRAGTRLKYDPQFHPMNDAHQPSPSPAESAEPLRIRWPIQLQLLVPTVAVVLLASLLATAITAYWIALRVRSEQSKDLRRVVETVGKWDFQMPRQVLDQISGLSGAEFVLLTPEGSLRESTLPMERPWLENLARIARSRRTADSTEPIAVSLGDRSYLVDFVRLSGRAYSADPATLFILCPEDQLASRIRQVVYPALLAGLIAAAIAMAIATWLARRFARPIRTLVAQTATIAQGDFTPMPIAHRNDEIRDLAESINRMTAQLAAHQRQIQHNERLKTLGQLGASMAHQLRNAATGGRMAIELHRRDCPHGPADESLDVALRQLRLMESYLRQFLSFGQAAPAVRRRVDAVSLVEEVLGLVRPSCLHAGIDLQLTAPSEPLHVDGDPEALRQLVTNLVLNAVDAAAANQSVPPRVVVEIARNSADGSIRVRDTGLGPPHSVHDQLFHSFVTTKPDGFGLGLFVARHIADRHGGRLHWQRDGDMTCFVFDFPLAK
jgi:signal transduction histidine kinase